MFQNWKYVFAILSQLGGSCSGGLTADQVVPKQGAGEDEQEPVPAMVRIKYGGEGGEGE